MEVGWVLIYFCMYQDMKIDPDGTSPYQMCKYLDNHKDGSIYPNEESCVYWAETIAQRYYDSKKIELEYSCSSTTKINPHGKFVPHRRD